MSDDAPDHSGLLEGIDDDLRDAAAKALDAAELLKLPNIWKYTYFSPIDEAKPDIVRPFHVLSGHDIDGMTALIEEYESTLREFTPNMRADDPEELPELRRAYDLLDGNWYGDGAEAATLYVSKLSGAFQGSALLISELAGGVIAARDVIANAREDLRKLADTFYTAAEQYVENRASSSPAYGRMAAWATVGVAVGLITGGMMGVVAAVGGIAGSLISAEVAEAEAGTVSGDNPMDIIESFQERTDELLSDTTEIAEDVARKIGERVGKIEEHPIPPPPDVSPGASFDPDNFRTDSLPGDVARAVRDANVDIDVGGGGNDKGSGEAAGGLIMRRLDAEEEEEEEEEDGPSAVSEA